MGFMAQTPPPQQQPQQGPGLFDSLLMPMLLMLVAIYFFWMRPQRRQQLERDKMLKAIKKNDHVLTHSGIYGIVERVSETDVTLKVDENKGVKIRMSRASIASVEKVAPEEKSDSAPGNAE
jgi:preprotein translocase subunit YajC